MNGKEDSVYVVLDKKGKYIVNEKQDDVQTYEELINETPINNKTGDEEIDETEGIMGHFSFFRR